MIYNKRYKVFC